MTERLFLRLDEDALHGPESTAPAGTLTSFAVTAPLRAHVSQLLLYRETLPGTVEVQERVIPDGSSRLVIHLGDAPPRGNGPSALALGASAVPALVRLQGRMEGFSIALRPGAVAALFGMPAGELADQAVSLDSLWGANAAELLERLACATSDAQRAAVVEGMLRQRLDADEPLQARAASRAAAIIRASGGRRSLREVASELGLGERRLQQLFHTHVGLTPRVWGRLARIHDVLRSLRRIRRADWAGIAVEHGYYDQAHLANEFRALCGFTPTEYFRRTISCSSKTER